MGAVIYDLNITDYSTTNYNGGTTMTANVPCDSTLPAFDVVIGNYTGIPLEVDPSALIVPGSNNGCVLSIVGSSTVQNDEMYLGQAWLKGKWMVFDKTETLFVGNLVGSG